MIRGNKFRAANTEDTKEAFRLQGAPQARIHAFLNVIVEIMHTGSCDDDLEDNSKGKLKKKKKKILLCHFENDGHPV